MVKEFVGGRRGHVGTIAILVGMVNMTAAGKLVLVMRTTLATFTLVRIPLLLATVLHLLLGLRRLLRFLDLGIHTPGLLVLLRLRLDRLGLRLGTLGLRVLLSLRLNMLRLRWGLDRLGVLVLDTLGLGLGLDALGRRMLISHWHWHWHWHWHREPSTIDPWLQRRSLQSSLAPDSRSGLGRIVKECVDHGALRGASINSEVELDCSLLFSEVDKGSAFHFIECPAEAVEREGDQPDIKVTLSPPGR